MELDPDIPAQPHPYPGALDDDWPVQTDCDPDATLAANAYPHPGPATYGLPAQTYTNAASTERSRAHADATGQRAMAYGYHDTSHILDSADANTDAGADRDAAPEAYAGDLGFSVADT